MSMWAGLVALSPGGMRSCASISFSPAVMQQGWRAVILFLAKSMQVSPPVCCNQVLQAGHISRNLVGKKCCWRVGGVPRVQASSDVEEIGFTPSRPLPV